MEINVTKIIVIVRPTLGFEGLQLMAEKYRNIPDYRKVVLTRLDMLLQCKQIHEAKQLAEDIITGSLRQ